MKRPLVLMPLPGVTWLVASALVALVLVLTVPVARASGDAPARRAFAEAQRELERGNGEQALRHLDRVQQLLAGTNMRVVVARIQALGTLARHRELLAAIEQYKQLGPEPSLAVHAEILELERKARAATQQGDRELASIEQREVRSRGARSADRLAAIPELVRALDQLAASNPHVAAAVRARALRSRLEVERCKLEHELLAARSGGALEDYRSGAAAARLVSAYGSLPGKGCKLTSTDRAHVARLERHLAAIAELRELARLAGWADKAYRDRQRRIEGRLHAQREYRDALVKSTISTRVRREQIEGADRKELDRRIRDLEAQLVVSKQAQRRDRRLAIERDADGLDRTASKYRRKAVLLGFVGVAGVLGGITMLVAQPIGNQALDYTGAGIASGAGIFALIAMPRAIREAGSFGRAARDRRRDARRIQVLWSPTAPAFVAVGGAF